MLNIVGEPYRFCDGLERRSFLKIGGLALGGVSLPQLLTAESLSHGSVPSRRPSPSHKSVIMVYLAGGPSQLETVDMKPDAPREIRGPLSPIPSNVSGLHVSELMPRTAKMMDKVAVIRSVVGAPDDHSSFQCYTGRWRLKPQPTGGWPTFGSVASKLLGPVYSSVPSYVDASPKSSSAQYRNTYPSFLDIGHQPFRPSEEASGDMILNGITLKHLEDRRGLLAALDQFRRRVDSSATIEGLDTMTRQAFGLLTSGRLAEAFDIQREDPRVIERYGKGGPTHPNFGAVPKSGHHLLLALRLVQAGVRCVTVSFGAWDWHGNGNTGVNAEQHAKEDIPMFDQSFSALVEDLHARGLDEDVTVIAWGEFGRTPRINKNGGRDHWPAVGSALLAGGGMRVGQVIGATDRHGAYPNDRPVHVQEILATLYHNLGIDVNEATVTDLHGRPRYLVEENRQPIMELF